MINSETKTEVIAGLSTFLTMAYIAFVNPDILSQAGMDKGSVFTATCLVTAFACAIMGWYANTPIAVAPGMALNVYFTYSVVQGMGLSWEQGLAIVFSSGLLFLLITFSRFKSLLTDVIPPNLQVAILIGISLLIAMIALKTNGIIINDNNTLLHLGNIARKECFLFCLGFLLIVIFDFHKFNFAVILGILIITFLSILMGLTKWQGFMARPPALWPTLFAFDFNGFFNPTNLKALFTFFLIMVFDASGTLIGLLSASKMHNAPNFSSSIGKSLTADAAASTLAGLLGSSSTSPYIESAAGINVGGKTGLTALVVAACFLLMLFFYPLVQIIPAYAVGPALLYVACSMLSHVTHLNFSNIGESAPAALTIILIPFTSSIADGLGAGIILFVLIRLLTRQTVKWDLLFLSLIFGIFFLMN